jgi:hypothetical protein
LKASFIDQDLIYAVEFPMFYGEVRIGSAREIIQVVYDTGSDWLVIPDDNCVNCDG